MANTIQKTPLLDPVEVVEIIQPEVREGVKPKREQQQHTNTKRRRETGGEGLFRRGLDDGVHHIDAFNYETLTHSQ